MKKIDNTFINELITSFINKNYKYELFLEIINFLNESPVYFDSAILINIFKKIPENSRSKYLQSFIENCTVKKTFDINEISSFLKLVSKSDEQYIILKLMLSSDFFPILQANEVAIILKIFNSQPINVLELLLSNNKIVKITSYKINDLIISLDKTTRKTVLLYLREKDPSLLDDETLLWIIQSFEQEEVIDLFKSLVINDKEIKEETIFKYLGSNDDYHLNFSLIDIYIKEKLSKYNNVKITRLFEIVKKYIIDYRELVSEIYPSGNIMYENINLITCQHYGFNKINFNQFISLFGYEAFHFLDCQNIQKLLKLDNINFNMIFKLFTSEYTEVDNHTLNNILNAIYQREFLLENKEEYTIFHQFEKLISEKNSYEISKKLKKINKIINLEEELSTYQLDIETFIVKLISCDHTTKDLLHKITNKYIMICREYYVKEKMKNAHNELKMTRKLEKNSAKKVFFKTKSVNEIIELLLSINHNKLSQEQIDLLLNKELLNKIIQYKISPQEFKIDENNFKYVSLIEKMVNILWEEDHLFIDDVNNIPYIYIPNKIDNEKLLSILSEIDINHFILKINEDNQIYENMLTIFKKYKIMGWGNIFDSLVEKIDLSFDTSFVSTLINYFYVIYPEVLTEKQFNLIKLITYGNCYASNSNKFVYLFGDEDYKLICANEGNYKAPAPKNKRLELAVQHLKEMYNKKYVSIPSYEKNYTLRNNKIINVVVGNSTSMKNLTIGERTDSCLRICGIFYDLYKFVISNQNGFNICFYDKNNNLVSRVSGVRNGNTVFLNELRNSLSFEYDDNDLYDIVNQVANDLIKLTTNSELPIDNVVIASRCALSKHDAEVQYIGEDVMKNCLYNLPFNYDIDGFLLLLASRQDGKFVKQVINNVLPTYLCQSDKIEECLGEEKATKKFIQFILINGLLNGKTLDEIEIPSFKIKNCVKSDKFIIIQDFQDNISYIILDIFKDDQYLIDNINSYLENNNIFNITRRVR